MQPPISRIFYIAVLTSCVICYGKYAEDDEYVRPDTLPFYLSARKQCKWHELQGGDGLGDQVNTCGTGSMWCKVPMDAPEGYGHFYIIRIGNFTTTGGSQEVICQAPGTKLDEGTFVTRNIVSSVDPFTGDFFGYPPIHLHHAFTITFNAYKPPISSKVEDAIPWLRDFFPGSSSAVECLRAQGGTACYARIVPAGYGLKVYNTHQPLLYSWQLEDVRALNSPPLTHALEFGEFRLTKPRDDSLPALKASSVCQMSVGGQEPPFTYNLQYNTSMYIAGTYYVAVRMHLMSLDPHFHSVEGDEMWAVRGTQADLGIPEQHQSPVFYKKYAKSGIVSAPVALDEGDSLDALKIRFEESIRKAGIEWDRRHEQRGSQQFKAEELGQVKFKPFDARAPQLPLSPVRPEILCKFYGTVQRYTSDDVKADRQQFQASLARTEAYQHQLLERDNSTAQNNARWHQRRLHDRHDERQAPHVLHGSDVAGVAEVDAHGWKVEHFNDEPFKIHSDVDLAAQFDNAFDGVLPGNYYRHPLTSQDQGDDARYAHCNSFKVQPGEYITLVYFNVPRVNPMQTEEETYQPIIKAQHTRLTGVAFMPDIPGL